MWISELDKLRALYLEYKEDRQRLMDGKSEDGIKKKKVISKGSIKKINKLVVEE